jgi:hypothetical protein
MESVQKDGLPQKLRRLVVFFEVLDSNAHLFIEKFVGLVDGFLLHLLRVEELRPIDQVLPRGSPRPLPDRFLDRGQSRFHPPHG